MYRKIYKVLFQKKSLVLPHAFGGGGRNQRRREKSRSRFMSNKDKSKRRVMNDFRSDWKKERQKWKGKEGIREL